MFIETARVVSEVSQGNPNGYVTINKTDLTDEHELFVGTEVKLPTFILPQVAETVIEARVDGVQIDPALIGTEEISLGENDGDVTAAQGSKKPWEVQP